MTVEELRKENEKLRKENEQLHVANRQWVEIWRAQDATTRRWQERFKALRRERDDGRNQVDAMAAGSAPPQGTVYSRMWL